MSAAERSLRAQVAAHTRWAHEDPTAQARRGQEGLKARLREQIVEKCGDLDVVELERRVESARQAHMKRLALASAKARRLRREGGAGS